jgi:hypothetical protein
VFHGIARIGLPLAADTLATRYNELHCSALPPNHRFDLSNLAILFELSLGLSAWKSYGAQRWALRCNPLSGNLHPTEGYPLCPALPVLSGGVYHYLSQDHFLEHRAAVVDARGAEAFPDSEWCSGRHKLDPLARGVEIRHTPVWRHCQHDCRHVIAALSYAAAALGWRRRLRTMQ